MKQHAKEMLVGAGAGLLIYLTYLGYNLWPLVLLGILLYFLFLNTGLRGTHQRKYVTLLGAGARTSVDFADIGGQDTAKRELSEALEFLKQHDQARELGIRPLKGILLTGPPGTGKTMLAKAAATHTDSVFISTSGSEFIEIYAGVGAQRVRDLFKNAREGARKAKKSSAIVFVDEIEILGGQRGKHSGHLEYDQTLNQLLVEMDGMGVDDPVRVLLIGASNRADLLDSALMRPGRFDRIVRVDLPDREGRRRILDLHLSNKPLGDDIDLDRLAQVTFGFSGAHLESVTNEAAILALREGFCSLRQAHLEEAIDKVILGEKMDRKPAIEEMKRIAIHEAGHALMAEIARPGSVAIVQVVARGGTLGHVRHTPPDDRYVYERDWLESDIAILLAGAVAEELVTGGRSSGSANDFEQAVSMARRIVFMGLSSIGVVDRQSTSPERINQAVNELLKSQELRAHRALDRHQAPLTKTVAVLLEQEKMGGEQLRRLLAQEGFQRPEGMVPSRRTWRKSRRSRTLSSQWQRA